MPINPTDFVSLREIAIGNRIETRRKYLIAFQDDWNLFLDCFEAAGFGVKLSGNDMYVAVAGYFDRKISPHVSETEVLWTLESPYFVPKTMTTTEILEYFINVVV